MNVQLIKDEIAQYAQFLQKSQSHNNLHLWESIAVWQENDILEGHDFINKLHLATQNTTTRRMWIKEHYEPIKMMELFYTLDPDFVRNMYHQLFQSEAISSDDIDRFKFLSDTMLDSYREANPLSPENNHFQTTETITKYLAHQFPDRYTIYAHEPFIAFLKRVKAKEVEEYEDVDRFLKVGNIVGKFMSSYRKDGDSIVTLHQKRTHLGSEVYWPSYPMFFYEMLHINNDTPIHY